jgi:hypothetical protein
MVLVAHVFCMTGYNEEAKVKLQLKIIVHPAD